jgi:hypothetical protein
MASLISNTDKINYANVFNDIHDTFSRPIYIWKTPKKVVVATNSSHNFLYEDQESLGVSYIPVSGVFDARIEWGDASKLIPNPDIKPEIRGNVCRIKVKKDAAEFLSDAKQIEIDGRKMESIGTSRPHGLFAIDFYTLFFKESN